MSNSKRNKNDELSKFVGNSNELTTGFPPVSFDRGYLLRGLAMLMIIFVHSINEYEAISSSWSSWVMVPEFGFLGCSLFFFMSGYGLFLSLTKKEVVTSRYLAGHIAKILKPYLVCFVLTLVLLYAKNRFFGSQYELSLGNLLILNMPEGTDMWFVKVILADYIVTVLLFMTKLTNSQRLAILTALHIAAILLMHHFNTEGYWYFSNLCFPLGAFWAIGKPGMRFSAAIIAVAMGLGVLYNLSIGLHFPKIPIEIAGNMAFCILAVYAMNQLITASPHWLVYIGKNSLLFYLLNFPAMLAIESAAMPWPFYFALNLASTTLLVVLYKLLSTTLLNK